MDMFERISADIKSAMLARDKVRLETLRGIKELAGKADGKVISAKVRELLAQ